MTNDFDEKPVTLSQAKSLQGQLKQELKQELKEELSHLFARFHNDILEPRFQAIDSRFDGVDAKLDDHDRRFDHLFKKVEDLHHEYIISNEQMRRLEAKISQ
ncbi:MAG TPA: hypothetical protein VLJ37_06295 [bacterium]|nr:hypothetical protein [bacterium]